MNKYYPNLFKPLTVGKVTFKNRIFSGPTMMCQIDGNGYPNDYMIAYYAEKARGGAAVVTIGDTPVDREHAATNPRSLNLSEDSLPILSELAMAIQAYGAKASLELNHGGLTAVPEANGGNLPIGPVTMVRDYDGVQVTGMDEAMMNEVADHYAHGASLLKQAGFDMCLLHGGHGWLLHQFLSTYYNTRTDEYGGSLENRARFPLMVIDRVRQAVGPDFPIEYRMSGSECIEGGYGIEDAVEFAKMIDGKVDLIHVSAALDTEDAQAVVTHPTIFLPHGVNVKYAAEIKKHVSTPVITIGAISDPEMAEEILASGKADAVAMVRALIADPYFPEKARKGRRDEIIPCMRCLDCLTGMQAGRRFQCSVNSRTGREFRYRDFIQPAGKSLSILVAGGGPGGMKAAVTAAQRGHRVTLAEKTGSLGGLLKFTDRDPLKEDLRRVKKYLIDRVNALPVEILLNTEVTADFVRKGGYDAVIAAVGSTPVRPPIPGLDGPDVRHALEVYDAPEALGRHVALLGGGLVGCETALFLAERGHSVTIVEMQDEIAPEANWMHKEGMMQAFAGVDIECRTGLRVTEVRADGVCAVDRDGEKHFIAADSVVYAMGMRANSDVAAALEDSADEVVAAGDCVRARKASNAMYEGFWAAVNLS